MNSRVETRRLVSYGSAALNAYSPLPHAQALGRGVELAHFPLQRRPRHCLPLQLLGVAGASWKFESIGLKPWLETVA
jgi:hypothetical protein